MEIKRSEGEKSKGEIYKMNKDWYRGVVHRMFGKFGYVIRKDMPRGSTEVAMEVFGNKEVNVCEVGVLEGNNVRNILENLNVKKIYLIDPYNGYIQEEDKINVGIKFMEKVKRKMIKNLESYKDKIVLIEEDSFKAVKRLPDDIDFIYLDANHDYYYIKKEFELYWSKLKKGGILAGHDNNLLSVSKAALEFSKERDLNLEFKIFDWIIRKD